MVFSFSCPARSMTSWWAIWGQTLTKLPRWSNSSFDWQWWLLIRWWGSSRWWWKTTAISFTWAPSEFMSNHSDFNGKELLCLFSSIDVAFITMCAFAIDELFSDEKWSQCLPFYRTCKQYLQNLMYKWNISILINKIIKLKCVESTLWTLQQIWQILSNIFKSKHLP